MEQFLHSSFSPFASYLHQFSFVSYFFMRIYIHHFSYLSRLLLLLSLLHIPSCSSKIYCHLYFSQPVPVASRGSAAARLQGLLVRILPGAWMSVMSVMCCQLKVCASEWSLIQRSPTECVSEFDREGCTGRTHWPTCGRHAM